MSSNFQEKSQRIGSAISAADKIAILIGEPSFDQIAAGLGLALSLQRENKKASVFIPQKANGNFSGINVLSGVELIKNDLQNDNLSIIFNYPLENIDKVSSNDNTGKLKLIIKTKAGSEPIDRSQVSIVPQREKFNLIFAIGNKDAFALPPKWFADLQNSVCFSNVGGEKDWAKISVIEPSLSYSEIIARLIQFAGLSMNRQVGKNLYLGIKESTGSFEKISSYHTLEAAALCFKTFQSSPVVAAAVDNQPVDSVENKEVPVGGSSFPAPKIFKGSTTPKI